MPGLGMRLVAQLRGVPDRGEQADQGQLQRHREKHHNPEIGVPHSPWQPTRRRVAAKVRYRCSARPPIMGASMAQPTREELLTLALGVLPELPDTVDVLSEDGGCFPLNLAEREEQMLLGYAPRGAMRTDLHLLARVYYPGRGRYEVEFEVGEHFFPSVSGALVHPAV